jgi:hypothetical protein
MCEEEPQIVSSSLFFPRSCQFYAVFGASGELRPSSQEAYIFRRIFGVHFPSLPSFLSYFPAFAGGGLSPGRSTTGLIHG